jgi:hypothetical protein
VPLKPNPLRCVPFTAVTHPLSVLNDPLVHTGHYIHDGGSARAGQALGSACRAKMVNSAWAGTYGGFVVGQDGQGLLRTLHRQVRRLLARRAASPNPDGRLEHTPLQTATRRPQHDGGTPWSEPAALRVRVCESCPSCVATRFKSTPREQCRWESQQCTGSLPIHAYPPMRLAGYLSEAHTSGETQTLEARGIRHPSSVLLCGKALRRSEETRLQGLERAQQLTRAVHVHPTSGARLPSPQGCARSVLQGCKRYTSRRCILVGS